MTLPEDPAPAQLKYEFRNGMLLVRILKDSRDDRASVPAEITTFPLVPLRNTVLFPFLFAPLSVGRPETRAAVEAALASEDKTLASSRSATRRPRP